MTDVRQYSTFYAGPFHFGIDVDRVQEVVLSMPATPVPLTSSIVSGLVNLRGQIVPAIDLRARLEIPVDDNAERSVSLIVKTQNGPISVRVDRLGDVIDSDLLATRELTTAEMTRLEDGISAARLIAEPLPDTVAGPVREVVAGVIQLERSLLLVLDPETLLTVVLVQKCETENH